MSPQEISKEKNLNQPEKEQKLSIEAGPISKWLNEQGLEHELKEPDHLGIENIEVTAKMLFKIALALKENGFNYLECQGGYDEGPGKALVSFYHLIEMKDFEDSFKPREVRLKVFIDRDLDVKVPSLYKIFRGSDWQERETYDMFGVNFDGHPHPKRLLMPEDWKGWPLRKDYVQPDFYEMQDAY